MSESNEDLIEYCPGCAEPLTPAIAPPFVSILFCTACNIANPCTIEQARTQQRLTGLVFPDRLSREEVLNHLREGIKNVPKFAGSVSWTTSETADPLQDFYAVREESKRGMAQMLSGDIDTLRSLAKGVNFYPEQLYFRHQIPQYMDEDFVPRAVKKLATLSLCCPACGYPGWVNVYDELDSVFDQTCFHCRKIIPAEYVKEMAIATVIYAAKKAYPFFDKKSRVAGLCEIANQLDAYIKKLEETHE